MVDGENDHVTYDSKSGPLCCDKHGEGGDKQVLLVTFCHRADLTAADVFVFG